MIQITLLLWSLLSPWPGEAPDMHVHASAASSSIQHALWEQPAVSIDDGNIFFGKLENFSTFSGISLADRLDEVTAKLGEPDSEVKDPYTGFIEHRYGDLVIGSYEGSIYYISKDKHPEDIVLNGIVIPLKDGWLHYYLGEPDFIAEDGDVYIRDYSALKIFRDDSGSIIAADLFDDTVS